MLHRFGGSCQILAQQIDHYGDRRLLRDLEGSDPYDRLRMMRHHLEALVMNLARAEHTVRAVHSDVLHIAVETDPDL